MAKKKRLNKRVVIILSILVLLMLGGVGYYFRNTIFPPDPLVIEAKAKAHMEAGEWDEAERQYQRATGFATKQKHDDAAELYFNWATMKETWSREAAAELSQTRHRELMSQTLACLRKALHTDADYLEAQEKFTEYYWILSRGGGVTVQEFIAEADKLLRLDPDSDLTYFRRALARTRLAETMGGELADQVLADFDKAIELKPGQPDYWLFKAQFLEKVLRVDEARETYEQGLEVNPDAAGLRTAYAQMLYRRHFLDEAVDQAREAIRRSPQEATPRMFLAELQIRERNQDEALQILQEAVEVAPRSHTVRSRLAMLLRQEGRTDEALQILREGVRLLAEPETQPATAPAQIAQADQAKLSMNYLLASALLQEFGRTEGDREPLLQEIRACLDAAREISPDDVYRKTLEGRLAIAEGDIDTGRELLEEAYEGFGLRLPPETATILINIYLHQNLPGRAEEILDRFLADPTQQNNAWVRLRKAQLELYYQNHAEALRYVKDALAADPEHEEARELKSLLEVITGQGTARIPEGMEPSTRDIFLIINRSADLWAENRRDEAVALMEDLFEHASGNMNVVSRLWRMYQDLGQTDKAQAMLDRARRENPDRAEDLRVMEQLAGETDPNRRIDILLQQADSIEDELQRLLAKADICRTNERPDQWYQYLQQARKIAPDSPRVIEMLFRYALDQQDWQLAQECVDEAAENDIDGVGGKLFAANLAIARRDATKAIPLLEEALAAKPDMKQARVQLGMMYLADGQTEKSREAFENVVESDPGFAPGVIGMMLVLEQQGEIDARNEWLERAYRLAPRSPEVAERYLKLQETLNAPLEEIIEKRELRAKQHPRDFQNLINLASLYEQTRQYDKAEKAYVSAAGMMKDKVQATGIVVAFYSRMNRLGDADKLIRQLLSNTSDQVGAYVLYGDFLAVRRPAEARNAFEKAIELDEKDPRGHLALARFLANISQPPDYEAAAAAMRRFVNINASSESAERELARYLIGARDFDEAAKYIDPLLAESPSDAYLLRLKAELILKRDGNLEEAEKYLSRAVSDNPQDPDARVARARVYAAHGEFSKAKADLEAAKRISTRPQIVMQLVTVYKAMQEYDNAELALGELLVRRKDYEPAIQELIELYRRRKGWRQMEQLLAEAREQYPNSPDYLLAEASMWKQRGDMQRCLQALQEAVKVAPNSEVTLNQFVETLLENKMYDRILAIAESYEKQMGFNPRMEAARGRALAGQGKTAEADAVFQATIEKADPGQMGRIADEMRLAYGAGEAIEKLSEWRKGREDWLFYYVLGNLYQHTDTQKAAEMLARSRDMAESDSSRATISQRLGVAYHRLGELHKATDAYLAALELRDDPIVRNNLAYIYAEDMDDPETALPHAEAAYQAMPERSGVLDTYGWVLAKLGRYDEAERLLRKAMYESDEAVASRYHLGWVYEKQRLYERALREYRLGQEMIDDPMTNPLYQTITDAIRRTESLISVGSIQ